MSKTIIKFGYKLKVPSYPEEYRPIRYYNIDPTKYFISNYGNVRNSKWKLMKTYLDKDDYETITLATTIDNISRRGHKPKRLFVHRLMMYTFVGDPVDDIHSIVNHKNGIPCCNFIDNLEYTSILGNTIHAKNTGLMNESGINSSHNKYPDKLIRKICSLMEDGYDNNDVCEFIINSHKYSKYFSSEYALRSLIYKLHRKITYKDIVSEYTYKPQKINRVDSELWNKLEHMVSDGYTNYEIMHKFGYHEISDNRNLYNKIIEARSYIDVINRNI